MTRKFRLFSKDLKKLTKDVPETAISITNLEVGVNELRRNMRISLAAIEGGNWMPAVVKLAGQSTSSYFLVKHEIEAITRQIQKSLITDQQEESDEISESGLS